MLSTSGAQWYHDGLPAGDPASVRFVLGIHEDVPDPDGPGPLYSMPGALIWEKIYNPGEFTVRRYATNLREGWITPSGQCEFPADTICWQYNFPIPPSNPFIQQGTAALPKVYWLSVQAIPLQTGFRFGWKTSKAHWNDDAVWMDLTAWKELRYPSCHPYGSRSIDLAFVITGESGPTAEYDWGDAPDPTYPTLSASAGASHIIVPGFNLGALIDAESDGQPSAIAAGDDITGADDEDGVIFVGALVPGLTRTVIVTASAAGFLDAWVDFNADGDWADAGEQIFAGVPLLPGPNALSFAVPLGAGGPTPIDAFARFRLSSTGGLSYAGPAGDGEVEDYMVRIYPRPIVITKSEAKLLPVGTYVMIEKNVVTANFGVFGWYFEEPARYQVIAADASAGVLDYGRSAAIGVLPPAEAGSSPWMIDDLVTCYGKTTLVGCELMLSEIDSWPEGKAHVDPVGQNNRSSGGNAFGNQPGLTNNVFTGEAGWGLNSVAMLVRLWGKCTCIQYSAPPESVPIYMWIDDGSDLQDGLCGDARGVKVRIPPGYAGPQISLGSYYIVTGIMRTDTTPPGDCIRSLWPRTDSDIQIVP